MDYFHTLNQRKLFLVFVLVSAVFLGACEQPSQPISQPPVANSSTNSNANSASTKPAASTSVGANLPVTMPLLDAMFADETFVADAKQAVQLTDEEVTKLEDATRNAVLELGADPSDDANRSTRSSTQKTQAEIEKILGKERTEQFFSFVRSRWATGSQELAMARPNEVPTDSRIVVNSPAYRMDIFKDGQLVKTYKIGIGYPEFPLPSGLRRAKEIIFNPTWTPPDEPWVKGKVRPGKTVEAGSKLNPLGPIKIPIGLPSLIHGGKDPSRLGTFASHGCVGLTSPMVQDFAIQLASLSGTPLTLDDVKNYEKAKTETKEVDLAQAVPVELRYETIVVENGKVTVYRDVYERGTNTEENLRKVLESYDVKLEQLSETERTQLMDALSQMAVDATGEAVPENADNTSNSKKSQSSKVTKNIKGKKEVTVEIAALRGKGYPAPVALMSR